MKPKSLEENILKALIRKTLMYKEEEIDNIYCKNLSNTDVAVKELLRNVREHDKTHRRFDMSGDNDHEDLLAYFDYLGLRNAFITLNLTFHKGCGNLTYETKQGKKQYDVGLCGEGTVQIIYLIFKVAFERDYYIFDI